MSDNAAPATLDRFRAMTEGTKEQWAKIAEADKAYEADIPRRVLSLMTLLKDNRHAFAVGRFIHCLQTATRAHRDGRDEEYVVCALLHDIGASIAPESHGDFAAAILRPHVTEQNLWMVEHHPIFQGYYYNHFFDSDRDERERFRGHPYFEYTAGFCERYDQTAFDPQYKTLPISAFVPMVHRVFAKRRR